MRKRGYVSQEGSSEEMTRRQNQRMRRHQRKRGEARSHRPWNELPEGGESGPLEDQKALVGPN